MVTHQTFRNQENEWVEPNEVHKKGDKYLDKNNKEIKVEKIEKMWSKSKKML